MLEFGDRSRTPLFMLAGCCMTCGREDGMKGGGNWEQRISRVLLAPSCVTLGTGMVSPRDLLPSLAWITPATGDLRHLRLSDSQLIKSQVLKGIKRHEKCC